MNCLLLLAVILVAAEASPLASVAEGYHDLIGIPAAKRLRVMESVSSRIVGGMPSYSSQHPFFAGLSITLTTGEESVCGGAILSRSKVLTAGRCWFDGFKQGWSIIVIMGTNNFSSGGRRMTTYGIVAHPQFNPRKMLNDLAMLTIQYNYGWTNYIKPVTLPLFESANTFVGVNAKVVGYGVTRDNAAVSSNKMQYSVTVPVISNNECNVFSNLTVNNNLICTSGALRWGPCKGDAGAPLIYYSKSNEYMLIGVHSFHAVAGCQSGYPFGYSRVTAYLPWIRMQMDINA